MMDVLVGIVVEKQSDLAIMKLAHDVLQALDIPSEVTVMENLANPLEKLYLYGRVAEQRGLGAVITGGNGIPGFVKALASTVQVPVIHVPLGSPSANESPSLSSAELCNTHFLLVVTEPGDAHVAGLWAAQTLAMKHRSVYDTLQRRMVV